VELYEVRPHPGPFPQEIVSIGSRAGLHTKAMVFDRKDVFVGSFNLDPRSSLINTEAGLYVESPELAAMVARFMDEGVKPDRSYRVLLDERGNMYWETEDGGKPLRYNVDPLSTFWQRWNAGLIRLLPVENQL
jgi:cardiolipin synthase C